MRSLITNKYNTLHIVLASSNTYLRQLAEICASKFDHVPIEIAYFKDRYQMLLSALLFHAGAPYMVQQLLRRDTRIITSSNMMMQCAPHNNAFGLRETTEDYRKRISNQASKLSRYLLKNPNAVCHFQEFPLNTADRNLFMSILRSHGITHELYATHSWSVATLLPENSGFYLSEEIMHAVNTNKELRGRYLVFQSNDSTYMINGHLSFRSAQKSYEQLYNIILNHATKSLSLTSNEIIVHTFADTNLSPSNQRKALHQAYVDFSKNPTNACPFEIQATILPSFHGHRVKEKNGDERVVSVDSYTILRIKPNSNYGETISFGKVKTAREYYRKLLGTVVGSAIVGFNVLCDQFTLSLPETAISLTALNAKKSSFFAQQGDRTTTPLAEIKSDTMFDAMLRLN